MGLGKKLQNLRNQRNISQKQVADALNLRQSSIAGYETNNITPSLDVICSLADFYNVSTDYLLGRRNENIFEINLENISQEQKKIIDLLLIDFKKKSENESKG